jgi:hypothetical protein
MRQKSQYFWQNFQFAAQRPIWVGHPYFRKSLGIFDDFFQYISDSQTMCRGTILCREDIENVPKKFQLNKGYIKIFALLGS